MSSALTFAVVNLVAFVVVARIFTLEARRGRRFVATGIRNAADDGIDVVVRRVSRMYTYVARYIITLSWYYSLHAFLKVILRFLAGTYTAVETLLHNNRTRARKIRIERKREQSHLSLIADHKAETALTPVEKAKRKEKALSGK
jgi:hypothetical protein